MRHAECHFVSRALTGIADECGDAGIVRMGTGNVFLGLVDALGHGKRAHEAAILAVNFLSEHSEDDLASLMRELHERLRGTVGAVAALCRVFPESGDLRCVGIGNIAVRILGAESRRIVPRDGVVGYMMPSPAERRERLDPGDVLVLHSDGIREHFDLLEWPGLLKCTAGEIASGVLERFGKKDDDASCIAMRILS